MPDVSKADWRNPKPGQVWERRGHSPIVVVVADAHGIWFRFPSESETDGAIPLDIETWRRWCKPHWWSRPAKCVEWKRAGK